MAVHSSDASIAIQHHLLQTKRSRSGASCFEASGNVCLGKVLRKILSKISGGAMSIDMVVPDYI
jgi:hypothetical protein